MVLFSPPLCLARDSNLILYSLSRDNKMATFFKNLATQLLEYSIISPSLLCIVSVLYLFLDNLVEQLVGFYLIRNSFVYQVIPCMAKLSSGKTVAVVHKILFTGKLLRCIRPRPSCTVHSKWFKGKTFTIDWKSAKTVKVIRLESFAVYVLHKLLYRVAISLVSYLHTYVRRYTASYVATSCMLWSTIPIKIILTILLTLTKISFLVTTFLTVISNLINHYDFFSYNNFLSNNDFFSHDSFLSHDDFHLKTASTSTIIMPSILRWI